MRFAALGPLFSGGAVIPLLFAAPLHAHHPMGGEAPATLMHGLMSGLAHPVIDLEHALFILAVAVLASFSSRSRLPQWLAFIGMTVVGATLHYAGWQSALAEMAIALSLVVAGGMMLVYRREIVWPTTAFFVVAGLFHGYGYGGAIIGSETGPVIAYLVGFSLIQALLLVLVTAGLWRLQAGIGARYAPVLRGVGVALIAVGGFLIFS
ncbi:MAG: HupE/UreJ family protein [Ectothiorhodospiraceae bacterium]|nr:HupE/UreJ family protein [Ectothiorhodospiraceae bacterium]MCH8506834.1 HupE/UreJ family protein [Ectothiorhodospiraceae bacterium]